METVQISVYTFDELSDEAKETARDWYRQDCDYFWCDESLDSIKTFCDHFGVSLGRISVGAYENIDYDVQCSNVNFRGRKLRDFNRDYMPTGFGLDCDLWMTFYDVFKATGDAKRAFDDALYEGFKSWRTDLEWQLSDECVDENIICNEYRFTANGKFWGANHV